jgi:hypothetical protein
MDSRGHPIGVASPHDKHFPDILQGLSIEGKRWVSQQALEIFSRVKMVKIL